MTCHLLLGIRSIRPQGLEWTDLWAQRQNAQGGKAARPWHGRSNDKYLTEEDPMLFHITSGDCKSMPPKRKQTQASRPSKDDWRAIAAEARRERDESIAQVLSTAELSTQLDCSGDINDVAARRLSAEEMRITDMSTQCLLSELVTGRLTSVEVVTAYLRRAIVAQTMTNCITTLLPERALKRARELDLYMKAHDKPIGLLHGLPISVKEMLGMSGLRQTGGYCALWDTIATADAHVLEVLWKAGAVFHARTTEPQSMMKLECHSNLWGRTLNPWEPRLSSGGSSGGEGALLAMHGSALGVGSDVGGKLRVWFQVAQSDRLVVQLQVDNYSAGSIRVPAAHCGIYGLNPTAFRIPTEGWSSIPPAADSVAACIGPMSRCLSDLSLFMKTVIDAQPWLREPSLIPLPWTPFELPDRPIRIGIMLHDGVVMPHPPVLRALRNLEAQLHKVAGVEVDVWVPHAHDEAWAIQSALYFPDGGGTDKEMMARTGEPMLPLTKWMIDQNPCVKKLSLQELFYWQEEREAYRSEYARLWSEAGVDAILCPVSPGVASRHDESTYWGYTAVWNLLDYPAVVFPVSWVDEEKDEKEGRVNFLSGKDEEESAKYDPNTFHGLPIGLQLVCRRFEDEKVLAILEYMEKLVDLPLDSRRSR